MGAADEVMGACVCTVSSRGLCCCFSQLLGGHPWVPPPCCCGQGMVCQGWPGCWLSPGAGEGVLALPASDRVLQQRWCRYCGWDGPSCGGIPVRRGAAPCTAVVMGVQLCHSEGCERLWVLLNLMCLLLSFPGAGRGFGWRRAAVLILPCRSKTPQLLVGACQLYCRSTG